MYKQYKINKRNNRITLRFIVTNVYLLIRFEEKNEPFLLENVSTLTHEGLYDNFNKKI